MDFSEEKHKATHVVSETHVRRLKGLGQEKVTAESEPPRTDTSSGKCSVAC